MVYTGEYYSDDPLAVLMASLVFPPLKPYAFFRLYCMFLCSNLETPVVHLLFLMTGNICSEGTRAVRRVRLVSPVGRTT